jgi:hypothetical protein
MERAKAQNTGYARVATGRVEYPVEAPMRLEQPPEELLGFRGLAGTCGHCFGLVKMLRSALEPYLLIPGACTCIRCGQAFFVKVDNLAAFDTEQRAQKEAGDIGYPRKR